ncbi:MAG: DNA replication complex GINS family protein [Thaumarchaeota archaeon]|nr:DNA replication complex GINS family protein [Nitrososphaerota archaeon]
MAETILEYLKRQLDSELQSKELIQLPSDFYSKISAYSQKLRRSSGAGASETAVRLIGVQAGMIESMSRQLLEVRARKAMGQKAYPRLLPEERYVCSAELKFKRRFDAFVDAVSGGQPSFIEMANRSGSHRNVTVRFTKQVGELVGLDLRRYGPFEVDDVASIPAASADILVSGGDAVEVYTRDDT